MMTWQVFSLIDANGDGFLQKAELVRAHADSQGLFTGLDADGVGQVRLGLWLRFLAGMRESRGDKVLDFFLEYLQRNVWEARERQVPLEEASTTIYGHITLHSPPSCRFLRRRPTIHIEQRPRTSDTSTTEPSRLPAQGRRRTGGPQGGARPGRRLERPTGRLGRPGAFRTCRIVASLWC